MSQHGEEFSKSNVVDKKWFIRIGHLWGLQVGEWEMPHPKNLLGYSFIIKGGVERERRPSLPFLSRCHVSIISSSTRQSGEVFLSLYGQAQDCHRTLEKYFQVSVQWGSFIWKSQPFHKWLFFLYAQSMLWGSLTWWHHWAGFGPYFLLLLYSFGGTVLRTCLRSQRACLGVY